MRGRRPASEQCLGEQAAALTDGELGTQARDTALAHLVNCDDCRDEVAGQRRLKARLGDLTDPVVPQDLLARLTAMSGHGAPEPTADAWQPRPVVTRHRVRLHGFSRRSRADVPPHRRGVRYAITGGVTVLALGVSAFAMGGGSPAPTVVPAADTFTVEHASTADEVPFGTVPQSVPFRPVLVGAKR